MKIIKGDLIQMALEDNFDIIVHGANCFCVMGAGIAVAIKNTFPDAYSIDIETQKGDKNKLGTISYVDCSVIHKNAFDPMLQYETTVRVVNAYTQYLYGGGSRMANYDAIRSCFQKIKELSCGSRIGYPKIGAGLAGGNWDIISKIIDEELDGEDHTLVVL